MDSAFIYLASQSPRRAELLRQLGLHCEIVVAPVDENPKPGESPEGYVERLARDKVAAALAKLGAQPSMPLLAADTVVVIGGRILGKPQDRTDGLRMLAALSGREHRVLSAVALWTESGIHTVVSISRVWFRALSPEEAAAYWHSGEPAGKAGAYAIQGRGAVFIEHLEGSYSGVMGLPLYETAQLLRAAGMRIL